MRNADDCTNRNMEMIEELCATHIANLMMALRETNLFTTDELGNFRHSVARDIGDQCGECLFA